MTPNPASLSIAERLRGRSTIREDEPSGSDQETSQSEGETDYDDLDEEERPKEVAMILQVVDYEEGDSRVYE